MLSNSLFLLFDSLACVAVFSLSPVASHSQSLLSYRHVFYLTCLPCIFCCVSLSPFSVTSTLFNLCSFCSVFQKHALTFLSLLFCNIFSLSMMENKQLAVAVSENCRSWPIQGLWKSPRRPSRIREIFSAHPGYERMERVCYRKGMRGRFSIHLPTVDS